MYGEKKLEIEVKGSLADYLPAVFFHFSRNPQLRTLQPDSLPRQSSLLIK